MSASDFSSHLVDRLASLARFGGEGNGVTRIVYDEAWCAAHRWLAAEARAAGLAATADAAGNLFFHDPAITPGDLSRPVLLVGSHLDSVRNGGRYDGAYGTIAGLELAIAHRQSRGLPVVGFVTCEEEESRFHAGLMGARSLLGAVERDELDRVRDSDGVSWREALEHARAAGCAAPLAGDGPPITPLFRAALMLELHIEQGPVLEREGISLGIVDHIAGYRRLRAEVKGEPRHSGTTPMSMRQDALAAAAEMILGAEALARETGAPAVATAGLVHARPGLYNVVPGAAEVGLEVRHVDPAVLGTMADALTLRCHDIAARRGVEVTIAEVSRQEPTALSPALALAAERVAASSAISSRKMASGAAHDTMIFARSGVPSLLVFVPSHAGISHSPDEFTDPAQLETGLRFASQLITWLTESRPPR